MHYFELQKGTKVKVTADGVIYRGLVWWHTAEVLAILEEKSDGLVLKIIEWTLITDVEIKE